MIYHVKFNNLSEDKLEVLLSIVRLAGHTTNIEVHRKCLRLDISCIGTYHAIVKWHRLSK